MSPEEEHNFDELFEEQIPSNQQEEELTVAYGLPVSFHEDGTPIFERSDIIRPAIPLEGEENPQIYQNLIIPEHRSRIPLLRFNLIVLPGNTSGVTRAWLGKSKLTSSEPHPFGRVIQSLDYTGRIILQRQNKHDPELDAIDDFVVLNMQPMQLAVIPPEYEVELVNIGNSPARFFEVQAKEETRDFERLIMNDGMGYIYQRDGNLQPNTAYDELSIPRIQPGLDSFKFLQKRPLYTMLVQYPQGFEFMDPPDPSFFHGAI